MTPVRRLSVVCLLFGLVGVVPASEAAEPRQVEIRYDFTATTLLLEVWVDCDRSSGQNMDTCDDKKKRVGPQAYGFELKASDIVILVMKWRSDDGQANIEYAVTGEDVNNRDLEELKKLFTAATEKKSGDKVAGTDELSTDLATQIKAVTDDLIAGGKLTVTYNIKKAAATDADPSADPDVRNEEEEEEQLEVVVGTSEPLTFRVRMEPPRFTVSNGIVMTTAPEPTVAIIKTDTIISFEKDGMTQQANEQVIILRDADDSLRPIQSLVTFANFRIYERLYGSVGFQLTQKIFEEPILGITYRHPLGGVGVNFTAGVLFSRELEIIEDSGFTVGDMLDPTIGLTVDDIPTEKFYHRRLALGFSLDF